MADSPDREQVADALGRMFDGLKRLSSALFTVGIVLVFVLIALAVAVYVFDPLMFQAIADSPQDAVADRARVFSSTTTAGGCAPNATDNATAATYQLLGARHLTITGNVTLPDASYELTEPNITERSDGEYVVAVDSRPTDSANQSCRGMAHYTAKVQLPYGANNYSLAVRHGDNRTLRIIERS